MTLKNDNGAYTVEEFLIWARIGRTKLYQEINNGRITPRKIGRKTLILKSDAESWLNNLPKVSQ